MINWTNIWELVKINILYSNPQILASIKKKQAKKAQQGKKPRSAYKSVFLQQGLGLLLFLALYGFILGQADYSKAPGFLSLQLAVFSLMSMVQAFSTLFTVFYNSKDNKLYLPLPITSTEVFLAKLLASQGMALIFATPSLAFLGLAYWQTSHSLLSLLPAFLHFLILAAMINAVTLLVLNVFGHILSKSRHHKGLTTLLMFMPNILVFPLILFVQATSNPEINKEGTILASHIPYFRGFYDAFINPFSPESLLHFWLGLVILAGLIAYICFKVMPHYSQQTLNIQGNKSSKRQLKKSFQEGSLTAILVRHHLSLLKDPTLLTQTLIIPFIFLFSGLAPILAKGTTTSLKVTLGMDFFGLFLLIGFLLGVFTSTPTSFLGVDMSLERENYHFIKTLPINFKYFVKQKFLVLYLATVTLPVALYGLASLLVLGMHPVLVMSLLLGYLLATFTLGEWIYWRDQKLLLLNWQNINQLFSRGHGQWMIVAFIFGVLIIGGACLGISFGLALSGVLAPFAVSFTWLFIISLVAGLLHWRTSQKFWKSL